MASAQDQHSFPRSIGIYGTGQVATALLRGLKELGMERLELIGRDPSKLEELGSRFGIEDTKRPEEAEPQLDLLLIAVKDDAFSEAIERLPEMEGMLAHCSGSLPLSVLEGKGKGQGVFWPVQSFSQEETLEWKGIPICIEGSDAASEELLKRVGEGLSDSVQVLRGDDRKFLHLAAVFACNFTNHFYGIARDLLGQRELPYELLRSLILQTARKGAEQDPREVQTGPAARGDSETVKEQLELLEDPELQELYRRISRRIMNERYGTSEF